MNSKNMRSLWVKHSAWIWNILYYIFAMPIFVTNQNCGSKFALIMILDFSILCGIYFTTNFFAIPCKEKSGNLWRIKVELTKHTESFRRELLGDQYFQCFYSFFFFPLWKERDRCISLLSKKNNHFMFA